MSISHHETGELDTSTVHAPWVLMLGGVTRSGNRRSRRTITGAMRAGLDVVWLDGFQEEDDEGAPVPLTPTIDDYQGHVSIVGFRDAEERTLAGRLRVGEGWKTKPILRTLWRIFGRRLGTILRPRACWRAVRSDMTRMQTLKPPEAIVYADDYAITTAWYAAKLWKTSPIVTRFPPNQE